jgi:uncharacterized protein (UPF0332 family)
MGLFEKSRENERIANKSLAMKAYNVGISRAYYAVFQRVEYELRNSPGFNYGTFLVDNQIERGYIPHGKMQLAMAKCIMASGKKIIPGKIAVYDNLYRKRRKADYTDQMYKETDLTESINEMNIIFGIIGQQERS